MGRVIRELSQIFQAITASNHSFRGSFLQPHLASQFIRGFSREFSSSVLLKMDPHNQALGTPTIPMKRKRGRPRKDESAARGDNTPVTVMPVPDNVFNSNQVASSTNDHDNEMVGKVVTGVIEGAFSAGYLLNVKVAESDAHLRGLVFLPGKVAPVTAENDVAPHAKMIQRQAIPIPVLNPLTAAHGSVPSLAQCNKPELQVLNSEEQVLPTAIHSGTSGSIENQSASTMLPVTGLTKNETSIPSGGIPRGLSEPVHGNDTSSIVSELEHDKTVSQRDETLPRLDASTQVKNSSADGVAAKDSELTFQPISLAPTTENTVKELRTGEQTAPPVLKLNEPIHEGTHTSNIELNQIPVSSEPESMPSEQVNKPVDYFAEKQASPKIGILDDTKTKLTVETLYKVDTSDLNGKPNTSLEVGSCNVFETSQPESMLSEQISKSVFCESKFPSEGRALQEGTDPQAGGSLDAVGKKVDVKQPTQPLVNSNESENQTVNNTA